MNNEKKLWWEAYLAATTAGQNNEQAKSRADAALAAFSSRWNASAPKLGEWSQPMSVEVIPFDLGTLADASPEEREAMMALMEMEGETV